MASSSQRASASLPSAVSSAPLWKYDVFLSFRGEDTRKGIAFELYDGLKNRRGIKTFMDDPELEVGAVISPSLLKAIEESRFAIIVLSPHYASSTWCLEELTKICQCMEGNNRILPLFYHVDPSDVRHQKRSFGKAFTKHEKDGQHREKVKQWRDALVKVASFSGWHTQNYKSERELVEDVVGSVCNKVRSVEIEFLMSTGDFEAFEATRQAMDKVMKALKDDKVTAIAVYGMGGVGKTTMVEYVGVQAQNNGIFHHVIMVVISQSPNLRNIQGTLADLLGLVLKEETNIGRADRLKKEIMRRNKILIILDDIWEGIELSSIGIPSYDKLQKCSSKVLLTTRRLNVCHSMEAQQSISLGILSKKDSWNLFVKKAKKSFEKSTEFYDVAMKVAGKCAGLPIALTTVARALGHKDLEEWKVAARRLETAQPTNLDDKGDVYKCIKLSYDYLNDTDAKSCFLLCCLFPADHDILIEDLMQYGFGKGLFRDGNRNDTMQKARATTNLVVKYLIASNLLLDSKYPGCVRMHDVIRDMAISIALCEDDNGFFVKTRCELKDWPMDAHEGYSAISLMENNICKLPNELVCSKLQILLLQGNANIIEIPKAFFQSPNALRVLDISWTSISLLPHSFNLLTNLQALYLDYCNSRVDISILRKLKKLEILSMRGCRNEEFPKEIGHLTNLRMLNLTHLPVFRVPSQVISRLHRLEELYMKCYFGDWGSEVKGGFYSFFFGKNAGFNELTGLSHLNKLEVSISGSQYLPKTIELDPNWVSFDICIHANFLRRSCLQPHIPHHFSRALSLDTTINRLPDWFINVVTKKAERLDYYGCHLLEGILVEYDHGRLHRLKYLTVGKNFPLKELMNTTTRVSNEPVFENLEDLHILFMYSLEELCVGELPPGSLCNLKVLNISCCMQLVNELLPSKLVQRLQSMEEVFCHYLERVEYVFGFEGLEPEQIILTKLRKMRLYNLHKLLSIWKGPAPHAIFHNLRSLAVYGCNKLNYIFSFDVAQYLFQLEDLWLHNCCNLEKVIEGSEEVVNNKKIVFPELKNLHLERLISLTRFYSLTGSATVLDIECPSLEHLYVYGCPQLLTSASDFNSRNHVQLNDEKHMWSMNRRLWDRELLKTLKKVYNDPEEDY